MIPVPRPGATALPEHSFPDSGRFTDGRVPDPGVRQLFAREHRWQRWLDVEAALALAEADHDVIPADSANEIAATARLDRLDAVRIQEGILATSHPLMALIRELADRTGPEHGGWVHWGATTQNITQTGDVLVLREAHAILLGQLADLLLATSTLARRGAKMVAAGRTHGQHAVPITFGFKVAGWIDELARHAVRLRDAEPRVFLAMTGGAVGNFASLGPVGPAVQDDVANRLGLAPMEVPCRASGDGYAEYVCALALIAGTGGRIAAEVYALMSPEVGEAWEPVPPGTVGSSTMPHKRNPQLADDCVTIGAQLRALVPLALEGMLSHHEVDGGHTAMLDDALERACVLSGDLLARLNVILGGLELNEARMRANLDLTAGLISSESIMLALGRHIGRQVAHDVVYHAAQHVDAGHSFAEALHRDPRVADTLSVSDVAALLDPASHVGQSAELAMAAADRADQLADDLREHLPTLETPLLATIR
jgi:3-carboxy-cis,cis-muconate cycloisomerase